MRQKWLAWIAAAPMLIVICTFSVDASAQGCRAGSAIDDANQARRRLGQLDTLEAVSWRERQRSIDVLGDASKPENRREHPTFDDNRFVFGLRYDRRNYPRLTLCRRNSVSHSNLGSGWWGLYSEWRLPGQLEGDGLPTTGGRFFYLNSFDTLSIPGGRLDWSDKLIGYGYSFPGEARLTLAFTHTHTPKKKRLEKWLPESSRLQSGWGLLSSVTLPWVGLRGTLATHPRFNGISLAELRADSIPLPGGLRGALSTGYLRNDSPLTSAAGIYDIPGGFSVEGGAYPLELEPAFARLRWSHLFTIYDTAPNDRRSEDHYRESGAIYALEPYIEASATFPHSPGDADPDWAPGVLGGLDARMIVPFVTLGTSLEIGTNESYDLLTVPDIRDRLFWSLGIYMQVWV